MHQRRTLVIYIRRVQAHLYTDDSFLILFSYSLLSLFHRARRRGEVAHASNVRLMMDREILTGPRRFS